MPFVELLPSFAHFFCIFGFFFVEVFVSFVVVELLRNFRENEGSTVHISSYWDVALEPDRARFQIRYRLNKEYFAAALEASSVPNVLL